MSAPILSIIICTCDRHKTLPAAIDSVLAQDYRSFDLIVVDNSSPEKSARELCRNYLRDKCFRYVVEPARGLSNARNKGLAIARGRYVAFIDDDAIASPDWATEIVSAFRHFGPKAACIGGRIVPRWLAPRPSWLTDGLLGYLSLIDWGERPRQLEKGEWLAGCNIAFEREALLDAGGFSPNLGRKGTGQALLSNEEIEVYKQLQASGRIVGYAPQAIIVHQISPDRLKKEWFLRRAAWQAVSDFIVAPEYQTNQSGLLARVKFLAGQFSRFIRLRSGSFEREVWKTYKRTWKLLGASPHLINQPERLARLLFFKSSREKA